MGYSPPVQGSQRVGHDIAHSTMDQMLKLDNLASSSNSATWQRDGLLFQPLPHLQNGDTVIICHSFKSNKIYKVHSIKLAM